MVELDYLVVWKRDALALFNVNVLNKGTRGSSVLWVKVNNYARWKDMLYACSVKCDVLSAWFLFSCGCKSFMHMNMPLIAKKTFLSLDMEEPNVQLSCKCFQCQKNICFASYFILTFCNFLNNDMSSKKNMTAICHLYPTIYAGGILSFSQRNAYITFLNVYTRSILGPFWPTNHAIDVVFINLPCTL